MGRLIAYVEASIFYQDVVIGTSDDFVAPPGMSSPSVVRGRWTTSAMEAMARVGYPCRYPHFLFIDGGAGVDTLVAQNAEDVKSLKWYEVQGGEMIKVDPYSTVPSPSFTVPTFPVPLGGGVLSGQRIIGSLPKPWESLVPSCLGSSCLSPWRRLPMRDPLWWGAGSLTSRRPGARTMTGTLSRFPGL